MIGYNWKYNGETIPTFYSDSVAVNWNVSNINWTEVSVDNSQIARQDWHGVLSNPTYARGRLITIEGFCFSSNANDRSTRGTARNIVNELFQLETFPSQGEGFKELSFTDDDGVNKFINAKVYKKPAFSHVKGSPLINFNLDLFAQDPLVYSEDKVSQDSDYGLIGGVALPTVLPIPLSGVLNPATITNAGDFGSPIKITVTGDIVNPKIYHVETGKFFKLARTLSSETLEIDTSLTTATIAGASVLSDRAAGSQWLYANPGVNNYVLLGDDFDIDDQDKATLTIEFYSTWL